MEPIRFKEANKTLTKPADMSDEECTSLPVFNNGTLSISCWQGGFLDRLRFLLTGKMWLGVHGGYTQPPVWLDASNPFGTPSPEARDE